MGVEQDRDSGCCCSSFDLLDKFNSHRNFALSFDKQRTERSSRCCPWRTMETARPHRPHRPLPIRSRAMKRVPIWIATAAPTQYWSGPVSPAPWATTPPISSRTPSLLSPVPIPIVSLQLSGHPMARIQSQSLVMIARITRYSQMTTAPGLCME
jgi:hypothetical protein